MSATIPFGGTLTLAWPSGQRPLLGNLLVMIAAGAGATGFFSPGSPWVYRGQVNNGTNDSISVYTKIATSSEVSYTVGAGGSQPGPFVVSVFEITGQPSLVLAGGATRDYGVGLIGVGPLVAYNPASVLRIITLEWDNRGPFPQQNPPGWVPITEDVLPTSEIYYHAAETWTAPADQSGGYGVQFDGAVNLPVWMDLVFVAAAGGAGSNQKTQAIWFL